MFWITLVAMLSKNCLVKFHVTYVGLIKTFDLGQYMVYPSKFVYKVVQVTEKIIAADLENGYLGKKYFFDLLC